MKQAIEANQVSTLCTQLLSQLDENIFFSLMSSFFFEISGDYKVEVYEVLKDGATRLRAVNGKVEESAVIPKGIGLSGYVARMKRAYYSNNVKRDPITAHSKRDDVVEAELALPIMHEGTVLGTIHIQSPKQERQFSEVDVAKVQSILKELAAPVRNMRLYILARQTAVELEQKLAEVEHTRSRMSNIDFQTGAQDNNDRLNLIAVSKSFLDSMTLAKKLSIQEFPLLLEGPYGVGKKMIARKIHFWSQRKTGPCILVHCTSMSEAAIDLELFGKKSQKGALAQANGGTLILDDVGALPLSIQNKLLRAMVTGEVTSLDQQEKTLINVRIVATSQGGLSDSVQRGEFKEELYVRLKTMAIKISSLKERPEDIRALAEHFLNEGRNGSESKILTAAAQNKLAAYAWPGNVQELKGMMERMSILVEGSYVDESDLPELKIEEATPRRVESLEFREMILHDLEKNHILATLNHLGGNKTRAAKSLGITVKTLYNKLHSYGLIEIREQE